MKSQSKRRQNLGVKIVKRDTIRSNDEFLSRIFCSDSSWYYRNPSAASSTFERSDVWQMLRRAKNYLSRRCVTNSSLEESLDRRRSWTRDRYSVQTLLDLFPSLKYAHSSLLPESVSSFCRDGSVSVRVFSSKSGSSRRACIDDVARSHSIRFDPVDSSRELYRYRLRVQECLDWARQVNLAPIMMTLTVFHRWHPLKGLVSVLKKAWNYFFTGTRAATRRAAKMGLCGYIRRMEETLNRGDGRNSGWHPHYHVILFVPRDRLSILSRMERELRDAWFQAVSRYFEAEFGESIPSAYSASFREHGLWFSRSFDYLFNSSDVLINDDVTFDSLACCGSFYGTDRCRADRRPREKSRRAQSRFLNCSTYHNNSFTLIDSFVGDSSFEFCDELGDVGVQLPVPPLRIVDNGVYMAKIMGWDSHSVYSGDKELTSLTQKDSFIPFDLLREDTAENNDLWVEYVLAMKGELNFYFSRSLTRSMKKFYEEHPERRSTSTTRSLPNSKVVARVSFQVYQLFYRTCCLREFFQHAAEGYDSLFSWCREKYREFGLDDLTTDPHFLPMKVDGVDLSRNPRHDPRVWRNLVNMLSLDEQKRHQELSRCWDTARSYEEFEDMVCSKDDARQARYRQLINNILNERRERQLDEQLREAAESYDFSDIIQERRDNLRRRQLLEHIRSLRH